MKKTTFYLFLVSFLFTNLSFSQELEIKWSEKMQYKDKADGYFSEFIDANDKYVYALFKNDPTKNIKFKKTKVVVFDKKTMTRVSSLAIHGYKENKGSLQKTLKLTYYKTVVQKDVIYVFWTKINSTNEELYVESFDPTLKKQKELIKIQTFSAPSDMKKGVFRKNNSSLIVLSNKKSGNTIIGWEVPKKNDYLKFKYANLESNLHLSNPKEIDLPVKLNDFYYGINEELQGYEEYNEYRCIDNGDIIVSKNYTADKKKGNSDILVDGLIKVSKLNLYNTLTYIKTADGTSTYFELPESGISRLTLYHLFMKNNKFQLYGEFTDLKKDPKGHKSHGVFQYELDITTLEKQEPKFIYFDKFKLETLFQMSDNNGDNKTNASIHLHSVYNTEKEGIVFVFLNQYFLTTSTSVKLYNDAIAIVKTNNELENSWTKVLDEDGSYERISIINQNNEMAIAYDGTKEKMGMLRPGTDCIEYACINLDSGELVSNKKLSLNTPTENYDFNMTPKIVENELYINYLNYRKNEGSIGIISLKK